MKVYGKNIYSGNLKLCTTYTHTSSIEPMYEKSTYSGKVLAKDILFIQDHDGNFIDVRDLEGFGSVAYSVFDSATRYTVEPTKAGEAYVCNITKLFDSNKDFEKYTLKEIISMANNSKEHTV